jgi:predicted RNase H-like HicB family nuclease
MRFSATLERGSDGTYLAWVDELPGCTVRGPTREDVESRLSSATRAFLIWAGEDQPGSITVSISNEVDSAVETEEDTEVLLEIDGEPLDAGHWEKVESWLQRSRDELVALLEHLTEDELESRREGSERTIREEIEHLAFVEFMYAAWTFDRRTKAGLTDFLAWTRAAAFERMRKLADQASAARSSADWAGAPRPEPWTARKAARRLVWHELLHLRAIEQARTEQVI